MNDELEALRARVAELEDLTQTTPRGRPRIKRDAVLIAVWEAVQDERFIRSWGEGKRSEIPSVLHACQIIEQRGKTRRHGGGGLPPIHFPDGRVEQITKAGTIRRYFNDAEAAALDGNDWILAHMRAWVQSRRIELERWFNRPTEELPKP